METLAPDAAPTLESSPAWATLPEPVREAVAARTPGDNASFDDLAASYNFRNTSDRRLVFTRLLLRECLRLRRPDRPLRVLDIGCGRGIGRDERYTRAVSAFADECWGIEPDESVTPPEGAFSRVQHCLLEEADLPEAHFDLAYSFMVMEHVADPAAFYKALARTLRPGGAYLFMTPNASHYFALITRSLKASGLEDTVLRLVAGSIVDDYHYPVRYRCNSKKQIARHAAACGFDRVDLAYLEVDGPRGYMRGPLRPLFHALAWKRTVIKRPDRLLTLTARMHRAGGDTLPA